MNALERSEVGNGEELAGEWARKLRLSSLADDAIAEAARTVLDLAVAVPPHSVEVTVHDGVVTLEGEVGWDYQKRAAEKAMWGIPGVCDVMNAVTVRLTPAEVERNIAAAFMRAAEADAASVQVEVEGPRVTLRGLVSCWAEKKDADCAAWLTQGVTDVRNLIEIRRGANGHQP